MNPYWNTVATPFLFVVILFGMYTLFTAEPGYLLSQSSVNSAAAAVASVVSGKDKRQFNAQNARSAIGSLARAGNPQK
jgi:hypothetical protein